MSFIKLFGLVGVIYLNLMSIVKSSEYYGWIYRSKNCMIWRERSNERISEWNYCAKRCCWIRGDKKVSIASYLFPMEDVPSDERIYKSNY